MEKFLGNLLVVIYCRVSTVKQGEGISLELQEGRAREFIARTPELQGYEVVLMVDKESGALEERTKLNEVRELVRQGRVRAVIGYDTDRVVRDSLYVVELARFCLEHGAVLMYSDGTVVITRMDELIQFVKGYTAGEERLRIRDRMMAAKNALAKSGKMPVGFSKGVYGFKNRLPGQKHFEIDEVEAEVVRWMYDNRLQLVPVYRIAILLNEMGIPTKMGCLWEARQVDAILRSETYVGRMYYNKARYEKLPFNKRRVTPRPRSEWDLVEVPRIVDEAVWVAVQGMWKKPQNRKRAGQRCYPLTGVMVCGFCGTGMSGRTHKKRWVYYDCAGSRNMPKRPRFCGAKDIRGVETEEAVLGCIKEVMKDPSGVVADLQEFLGTGGGDLGDEIKRLARDIAKCEGEMRVYAQQNAQGMIEDKMFDDLVGPLNLLLGKRRDEMAALEAQQALRDESAEVAEKIYACFAEYAEQVDALDSADWKPVLKRFGIAVTATHEELLVMGTLDPGLFTIARTLA